MVSCPTSSSIPAWDIKPQSSLYILGWSTTHANGSPLLLPSSSSSRILVLSRWDKFNILSELPTKPSTPHWLESLPISGGAQKPDIGQCIHLICTDPGAQLHHILLKVYSNEQPTTPVPGEEVMNLLVRVSECADGLFKGRESSCEKLNNFELLNCSSPWTPLGCLGPLNYVGQVLWRASSSAMSVRNIIFLA